MTTCNNREYDVGQGIRYDMEFRDPDTDALVDPSGTITVSLRGAGLAVPTSFVFGVDSEVVKVAVGRYRMVRVATADGIIRWRWVSTGDYPGAKEGFDTIRKSQF